MQKPIISIIVANYNNDKYLHDALNSILYQTFTNWECIIVDDGSTDNSRNIINSFIKKDPRFIKIFKQNGGVSTARNIGIKKTSGEYIMFLDSDDCLVQNAMEVLYTVAKMTDADRIGGRLIPVSAQFHYTPLLNTFTSPQELTKFHLYTNPIPDFLNNYLYNPDYPWVTVWRQMYRKKAINGISFPVDTINAFEDGIFMTDVISNIKNFVEIDNTIVYFRISPNSLCRSGEKTNKLIMLSGKNALTHAVTSLQNSNEYSYPLYLKAHKFIIKYIIDMGVIDILKQNKTSLYDISSNIMNELYDSKLMPKIYIKKSNRIVIWCVKRKYFKLARYILIHDIKYSILNIITFGLIQPIRKKRKRKL